ncbi:MAG: nucleotide exchange factor GrpE [Gemmatimonadota bacterium]|nr:nucleotide exchange factor GrpE [Gemmatimonadota bacterium]|tara:strand:+ start:11403 stop:12050 length:648 start_codon:yes stop_codon:yes gene_type:complete
MMDPLKDEELTDVEDATSEGSLESELIPEADEPVEAEKDEQLEGVDGPEPDGDALKEAEGELGNSGDSDIREEFHQLNDRHLRLVAEFNNFRRRTEQERLGAWSRAQADIVGEFLDVLDDLSRVAELDLNNATVEGIMEGVDLVEKKFIRMLEVSGVEVIDPSDSLFDPEEMEAVMRIPTESEDQDDLVAQVFQKGYSLKGILVRPARVSVYKSS